SRLLHLLYTRALLYQDFLVYVAVDLSSCVLQRLRHCFAYQGRRLSPCKVSCHNVSHLRFALNFVLPAQLRFMCESEGLEVRSIRRLRIGALSLARLPLGEWRYLGLHERF
ncbi:RNA-binding protein, partial [Pseudomonas aeruginosa]